MGKADAAKVSANLVAMTYITPLFGSILSDRFIGARYLIPVGMAVMGAGYFLGYKADSIAMINAMILVVSLGNGLFKSQIHAVTGRLFKDQKLLDKAFSTQYAIANIGSFLGTAIIGVLVMGRGYAFGFLVCALVLFAAALIFVLGGKCLGDTGKKPFKYDEKKRKRRESQAAPDVRGKEAGGSHRPRLFLLHSVSGILAPGLSARVLPLGRGESRRQLDGGKLYRPILLVRCPEFPVLHCHGAGSRHVLGEAGAERKRRL